MILTDKIAQLAAPMLISPLIMDVATGSTQVVQSVSSQELILNTVNLAITAFTSIVTTLGVAYINAKLKSKK